MRTTNAKTLIKQAFLQLIREKPIQKITIKEITEQANLSRSVFYLHYKDIYEVLKDIVEENISQLYMEDLLPSNLILQTLLHRNG